MLFSRSKAVLCWFVCVCLLNLSTDQIIKPRDDQVEILIARFFQYLAIDSDFYFNKLITSRCQSARRCVCVKVFRRLFDFEQLFNLGNIQRFEILSNSVIILNNWSGIAISKMVWNLDSKIKKFLDWCTVYQHDLSLSNTVATNLQSDFTYSLYQISNNDDLGSQVFWWRTRYTSPPGVLPVFGICYLSFILVQARYFSTKF